MDDPSAPLFRPPAAAPALLPVGAAAPADTRLPGAEPTDHLPWVVAVGASAGGLEALQKFFGAVHAPTQAAFVVIQHLAPDHRSMMPELLARHCTLPVQEAVAGERLQVDRVYLMPPGVLMTIAHELLVFEPRPQHGVSLPIDQFFRSLAGSMPERSVAVVLSGSGSDGASGAAALRAAGGFVMAQAPESARFDSMPRSVLAATQPDAVLLPDALAVRVLSLTTGRSARLPDGELVGMPSAKPALQRLFECLLTHSGVDFSQYKLPTMMRRIERRMAVQGCASVSEYADLVLDTPTECELLRQELLIPVTSFFRDPAAFEALGELLRVALRVKAPHSPLRIWCAGCATGEEAYSLAILAMESCHAVQRWPGVKVFATDVDPRFLAVGGAGVYSAESADALTEARLEQHFVRSEDRLTVRQELRQLVLFARHNLLEDAPFTKMDLVVCRNTLIYFQADAQERVMRRLQFALSAQGLMFLGSSESLGALQPDFQVLDAPHKLYRLVRPVLAVQALRDGVGRTGVPLRARLIDGGNTRSSTATLVETAQQALMRDYVPVSLLITPQRQLLHAWGPAEMYLRMPGGQPNMDVMRLLPTRLGAVVGQALHRALRDQQRVEMPALWLELADQALQLRVVARPLWPAGEAAVAEPSVLVSLEPLPPQGEATVAAVSAASGGLRASDAAGAELDRLAALERELSDTRMTLQTSVEESEAANEELQATNEELMSANEELQSTNEELQSVNEELYTVNAEYNAKLDMVNALHADLEGMSQATGIATLFVDGALSLVRFTPEATLLFRLRQGDAGRPITDFKCQLDYPELAEDLHNAIAGQALVEREVTGPAGARYLVRVLGYGDSTGRDRRAVLSLVDVSRVHDAERLQLLLDSLPDQVAVLDEFGAIVKVNRAWVEFSRGNSPRPGPADGTGLGVNYLAVLARSDGPHMPEVLRAMQSLLAGERSAVRHVYPCHSPDEQRWFLMQAAPLRSAQPGRYAGAVVTHVNITACVGPEGPPMPGPVHG